MALKRKGKKTTATKTHIGSFEEAMPEASAYRAVALEMEVSATVPATIPALTVASSRTPDVAVVYRGTDGAQLAARLTSGRPPRCTHP